MNDSGGNFADEAAEMVSEGAVNTSTELRNRLHNPRTAALPQFRARVDGCGRSRAALRGTDFLADRQLSRLPLPIEALRPEKHVGDNGNPASRNGTASPHRSWQSGVDSKAANCTSAFSSSAGVGDSGECLGHRLPTGRLVCVFRSCTSRDYD